MRTSATTPPTASGADSDGDGWWYDKDDLDLPTTARKAEHRETNNSEAVLISDRCIMPVDTDAQRKSVHTNPTDVNTVDWKGSVCWGDNHVSFEPTYFLTTKFNTYVHNDDNLFEEQYAGPPDTDAEAAMVYVTAEGPYATKY